MYDNHKLEFLGNLKYLEKSDYRYKNHKKNY